MVPPGADDGDPTGESADLCGDCALYGRAVSELTVTVVSPASGGAGI